MVGISWGLWGCTETVRLSHDTTIMHRTHLMSREMSSRRRHDISVGRAIDLDPEVVGSNPGRSCLVNIYEITVICTHST